MSNQLVVHLRVFRGKTLTYNATGQSTNENHKVSLVHGSTEWKKFLSHLLANGFIRVVVEKVLDLNKTNTGKSKEDSDYYQSVEDFKSIQDEIDSAMTPEDKVGLTAEQKQIKELTARLDALTAKPAPAKAETSEELKEARKKYEALAGKKGDAKWTLEDLNEKIEALTPLD